MENTGNILFEDDTPHWYVALGERWVGPLSASDVYRRVVAQEISWAHFVWKPGQPDWKRICDVKTFQAAVPHTPAKAVTTEVKHASKPGAGPDPRPEVRQAAKKAAVPPPVPATSDERIWFLYYNGSQFGPFSRSEVEGAIRVGKINGKVFVWKDGMETWKRLEEVEAFRKTQKAGVPPPPSAAKAVKAAPAKTESRGAPRRPLVAKIVMAHEDSVTVGVCRDVSVGGMQILTDRPPGSVGRRIKLNVSAPGQIEPFVAEGVVVRLLEDGRGFSFRFDKLPDSSRKSIETYIQTNGG